jgi:hypothetical protein
MSTSFNALIQQATSYCNVCLLKLSYYYIRSWSSSCGRQTVDQFVLVSGLPLGPMTRFIFLFFFKLKITFILFPMASSLTRKWVCSLECLHSLVRSLTTNNHILPSHLRLCSLFVPSYDSQGLRWKYSNPPPHRESYSYIPIYTAGSPF